MHASRHASNSDAVSEVVGQILIFGILSTVLILSLLGFNVARQGAADQVVEVHAESLAHRVAGVVVDAALFGENADTDDVTLHMVMDLPDFVEGQAYTVDLDTDEVTVVVDTTAAVATLFSSGAPNDIAVCDMDPIRGGLLQVTVTTDFTGVPAGCDTTGATYAIYLEDAT